MFMRTVSQLVPGALGGRGVCGPGPAGGGPVPVEGDSPTEGTVDGPLAPEPLPGGIEAEPESEMRPRENDPRKSDGVEEFKRMEHNAEDGRE